jgi:hypothetical protein
VLLQDAPVPELLVFRATVRLSPPCGGTNAQARSPGELPPQNAVAIRAGARQTIFAGTPVAATVRLSPSCGETNAQVRAPGELPPQNAVAIRAGASA